MSYDKVEDPLHILQFPEIIMLNILSFLSFNEIATLRIVCQQFNECCKLLLNRGFKQAKLLSKSYSKKLRDDMPEKGNEKIYNHLIYCDITFGVEAKLIKLSNTFLPYMEENICCFIPGKVLDEIFHVIRYLQDPQNIFIKDGASLIDNYNILFKELRSPFIMKELNDLTTMAIEYFEEHIALHLEPAEENNFQIDAISTFQKNSVIGESNCNKGKNCKVSNLVISALRVKLKETCQKINKQDQEFKKLCTIVSEQSAMLESHKSKFLELNKVVADNEEKMKVFMSSLSNTCEVGVDLSKKANLICDVKSEASTTREHRKLPLTLRSSTQRASLSHKPKRLSYIIMNKSNGKKNTLSTECVMNSCEMSDKSLASTSHSSKRKRDIERQSEKSDKGVCKLKIR